MSILVVASAHAKNNSIVNLLKPFLDALQGSIYENFRLIFDIISQLKLLRSAGECSKGRRLRLSCLTVSLSHP
jgi:hypothetical protein